MYMNEYDLRKDVEDVELELHKFKQEKTCYNHNEDDGEISYHEYIFQYCPHCGRKIRSRYEN